MNDTERVWEVTIKDQLAHALSAVVLRAANKNLNTCRGQVYINSYRPLNDHLSHQFTKETFMLCTVIDIRGDYAFVKYDDTGVVSEVAIALLPFGIDVGDKLKFDGWEFIRI